MDRRKRASMLRAMTIATPLFGLILAFQNCAPAASVSTNASLQSQESNVPMSKVVVRLAHDSGITLSDVELMADDVMTQIDSVNSVEAMSVSEKQTSATINGAVSASDPQAYNLEIPVGASKIIVARAKYHDPVSNRIATYYGNSVVQLNQAAGEVIIQMVAIQ